MNMNFEEAKSEFLQILARTEPQDLVKLVDWMKNSGDSFICICNE